MAAEISVKHPTYQLGLIGDDFQTLSVYQTISEGSFTGNELPPLHPSLVTHPLVLGDGDGLLLGQRTGNAHHQFGGERSGVDILFFKLDGYAQPGQFPQGRQAVSGVAGKSGYGFDQHLVDLPLPAVRQQSVEILPLVHPGACDR